MRADRIRQTHSQEGNASGNSRRSRTVVPFRGRRIAPHREPSGRPGSGRRARRRGGMAQEGSPAPGNEVAEAVGSQPAPGGPPPKGRRTFDRSLIDGPIGPAVWKIAWPTMLQNVIAGLQGVIDHAMVGQFVGYTANAAIGVSWQVIIVVIVFISSLFSGMGVLVSRFAGANEPEKVNRVVYQAFITALALSVLMAAVGYFAAPALLNLVKAAPEVQREALPFLRAMFLGIFGMMLFFMLSGAFRAAGDPRTPMRLGVAMTVLTIV